MTTYRVQRPSDLPEDITPLQRARMRQAAIAMANGDHVISLACGFCNSTAVQEDTDPFATSPVDDKSDLDEGIPRVLLCITCGRKTTLKTAHRLRKQKITAFIKKGIDIPKKGKHG